ncbi:hypothetical protein CYL16_12930 [Mycobacterium sp. EPG1]|nr:hypothetical protein CYL16_12930 [Mycobacterium sp. EPG1]
MVCRVGLLQPAGAIEANFKSRINLLSRVVGQAIALRANRSFREVQLVHANTSRAALIGLLSCVASHRKLVLHLRDSVDPAALGSLNSRLLGVAISRSDGVIANSAYTLRSANGYIRPGTPCTVIPSPIGLVENRIAVPVKQTTNTVGMLARITPWKGQDLLIRAFARAFRGTNITLELAGSADFGNRHYLDSLRKLVNDVQIERQVRFLGHVTNIWPLLDSWDICVHASTRSEPLGQNVLQYLAACRPTIAADSGGPKEWITDGVNGALFGEGDEIALSDKLVKLANDYRLREALSSTLRDQRPVPADSELTAMLDEFFKDVLRAR